MTPHASFSSSDVSTPHIPFSLPRIMSIFFLRIWELHIPFSSTGGCPFSFLSNTPRPVFLPQVMSIFLPSEHSTAHFLPFEDSTSRFLPRVDVHFPSVRGLHAPFSSSAGRCPFSFFPRPPRPVFFPLPQVMYNVTLTLPVHSDPPASKDPGQRSGLDQPAQVKHDDRTANSVLTRESPPSELNITVTLWVHQHHHVTLLYRRGVGEVCTVQGLDTPPYPSFPRL